MFEPVESDAILCQLLLGVAVCCVQAHVVPLNLPVQIYPGRSAAQMFEPVKSDAALYHWEVPGVPAPVCSVQVQVLPLNLPVHNPPDLEPAQMFDPFESDPQDTQSLAPAAVCCVHVHVLPLYAPVQIYPL